MFLVYNQIILQPHNDNNTKHIKKIWFVYVLLGFSVIVLFICMFIFCYLWSIFVAMVECKWANRAIVSIGIREYLLRVLPT